MKKQEITAFCEGLIALVRAFDAGEITCEQCDSMLVDLSNRALYSDWRRQTLAWENAYAFEARCALLEQQRAKVLEHTLTILDQANDVSGPEVARSLRKMLSAGEA